ncbi:hypothetical protein [Sinomicrobium weinanense]|uniref:Uncharacterized protein n=1 Tax=Sinomicrobium weinanense TaxID=2842200 RepID=A0A926JRN2_9FLAO|nr:hypothetical protein [Sinomicrobium weinanense]MBC9796126.1 hypothetical protein [Sinomicrobium weinanense]MBU3121877.1 hypothetical protein [Sinomicrobium weinanense]
MNFLRNTAIFALIGLLIFSCSKDDDNNDIPPQPETGYFVDTITLREADGNIIYFTNFQYDSINRLIGQAFAEEDGDIDQLEYEYNNQGQMTGYKVNGYLFYGFEYENNRITGIVEYDIDTDEVIDELPVTFSNGIYSVDGVEICKIDAQNQLLEIRGLDIAFLYGEQEGVHRHLDPVPARYLMREIDYVLADLTLSGLELKGWTEEGTLAVSTENVRNKEGLITKVIAYNPSGEELFIWDIGYKERELVE